jgi:hypothetical protein
VATACNMPPENSDSTSYGVARFPYTNRLAKRCTLKGAFIPIGGLTSDFPSRLVGERGR